MSSAGALDPAPPRTSWSSLPGKPLRTRGGCSYDSRRQPPFVGAPVSGANTGHPVSANAPRSQRDKGGGVVERPLDDNAAAGPDSCRRSAGALHPVSPRTSWCSSLPGTPLFAPGAGAPTAADASPFCRSTRLGCECRPSPWADATRQHLRNARVKIHSVGAPAPGAKRRRRRTAASRAACGHEDQRAQRRQVQLQGLGLTMTLLGLGVQLATAACA